MIEGVLDISKRHSDFDIVEFNNLGINIIDAYKFILSKITKQDTLIVIPNLEVKEDLLKINFFAERYEDGNVILFVDNKFNKIDKFNIIIKKEGD